MNKKKRRKLKRDYNNDKFALALIDAGYILDIYRHEDGYDFTITGNKVYGFYRVYNDGSTKLSIDHKDLFDKASRCPIKIRAPKTDKETAFVLEKMRFCATDEGYKISEEWNDIATEY